MRETDRERTRFGKVYVEITNVCNLNCSFCHGTRRAPRFMSGDEVSLCFDQLRGYTRLVYLHVMGEPLLHPEFGRILATAGEKGLRVNITTNGTLLHAQAQVIHSSPAVNRVNISLHSYEGNGIQDRPDRYLDECIEFSKTESGVISCLRLWNRNGRDTLNEYILSRLREAFPGEWEETRKGYRLAERVYLEYAGLFEWPDLGGTEYTGDAFCYGLREQCAVLADGTVTPCCLDSEGNIALGNLFCQDMDEILSSARARDLYEGFSNREAREELCRHCDYHGRYR